MSKRTTTVTTTEETAACPPWCTNHMYDPIEPGGWSLHRAHVGDGIAGEVAIEAVSGHGIRIYAGDIHGLDGELEREGLVTAAQAREFAKVLLLAAGKLDEIEAGR